MERFYFNPQTLEYQRLRFTGKQKLIRISVLSGLVLLLSAAGLLLRDKYIHSPRFEKLSATQQELVYEFSLLNKDLTTYEKVLDDVAYNDDHIYRIYFEVEPVPLTLRDAGIGGSNKYEYLNNEKYADLLISTYQNLDFISRKLVVQSKSFDEVINLVNTKEKRLAARPAIQPVSIKDLTRFGSSFGMRMHPILKVMRPHDGIDLTSPRGTNIYATADGEVIQAGYTTGGYGKKIMIDHGYGYVTLYGHCSEIQVTRGQNVKRGDIIGKVGSTGLSTTPHLHYEVHVNGRPVNPINYYANDLSAGEYEKMIELLSKADPSFDIN